MINKSKFEGGLRRSGMGFDIILAYSPMEIYYDLRTESKWPGTIKSPYAVLYDFDTQ